MEKKGAFEKSKSLEGIKLKFGGYAPFFTIFFVELTKTLKFFTKFTI